MVTIFGTVPSIFGTIPNTYTIHHSFDCCLINRSHHPLYIQIIPDASLVSSIALWWITCTIHCPFECSLINRLDHTSLLRLLSMICSLCVSAITNKSNWAIEGARDCASDEHHSIAYWFVVPSKTSPLIAPCSIILHCTTLENNNFENKNLKTFDA